MTDLSNSLSTQCEQLKSLLALLERELHLISMREPEALLKLVHEKTAVLDDIQETDATIAECYRALDASQQEPALTDSESALVEQSKSLLEKCKYSTAINQKAVEQGQLKLAHLRQLIVDVRAKESLTYDKSGNTKGGTLGKGISA